MQSQSPTRRRNTLPGALALLLLGAAADSQAQNLGIRVTAPTQDERVLIQPLGPDAADGPMRARVSLRMGITNNEATPIKITKIEILGQPASNFLSPRVVQPGEEYAFHNCNCNYEKENDSDPDVPMSYPVLIDAPYPATATIAVYVQGFRAPVMKTVAITTHTNDGGPLRYPAKPSDLRNNEAWSTTSNHPGDSQAFGLDTHVRGWNGTAWSTLYPGADANRTEGRRAYGMPVYAMASGTVCSALNDLPEWKSYPRDETGTEPTPTSPSTGKYSKGGNHVYVRTGDEIALYAHLQPGSIPDELLQPGATIKQGQYLGKVGYSGATSGPHVHIHVARETEPGSCKGNGIRPLTMTFGKLQSLTRDEADYLASQHDMDPLDWTHLANHSSPHKPSLLYPTSQPYAFIDAATDNRRFIGVWQAGNQIELRVNLAGWEAFTQKWDELSKDRFRLVEINTYVENGKRQYQGVFKRGGGNHALWRSDSWGEFDAKQKEFYKAGLRLADIASFSAGGKTHYVGAFVAGNAWQRVENTSSLFELALASNANSNMWGLELVDIEFLQSAPYSVESGEFIGVYRASNDKTQMISAGSYAEFADKWREQHKIGMRLIDVETYRHGEQRFYVGLFRPGTGSSGLELVTGYQKLFQSAEKHGKQGRRLVDVHVLP
ncbi:peptidase M23-like protein [Luteimonas cucumeris]|uniref:Peptidase M23-like protein n=1 Tax=Luteimonas cucumeris TaxID=985012 RepID=A0A562L6C4_9GAMM|nr:M23 family metallopeptidase [Luteimonas cucumeris]TWI02994.1 peptidase M23-like protein [Luteimonas cucumeris]